MDYTGVIIEESLSDSSCLDGLKIIKTEIEKVTPGMQTPWLEQWTLHTVSVPDAKIDDVAEKLSHSFDNRQTNWYADLKNDRFHYIIFPSKVFKVDRSDSEQYRPAVIHGLSLGIPIYQLDFVPEINNWEV
jgi:hypothetical protein